MLGFLDCRFATKEFWLGYWQKSFLEKLGLSKNKIEHILNCIISHRYRSEQKPKTLEAKIVFDADKLETVGTIGIARAFVWVGKNNAHI